MSARSQFLANLAKRRCGGESDSEGDDSTDSGSSIDGDSSGNGLCTPPLHGRLGLSSLPRENDKNTIISKARGSEAHNGVAAESRRSLTTNLPAKNRNSEDNKAPQTSAPAPGVAMIRTTPCPSASSIRRRAENFQRRFTPEKKADIKAKTGKATCDATQATHRRKGARGLHGIKYDGKTQEELGSETVTSKTNAGQGCQENRHFIELPKNFKSLRLNADGTLDMQTSKSSEIGNGMQFASSASSAASVSTYGSRRNTNSANKSSSNLLQRRRGHESLQVTTYSDVGESPRRSTKEDGLTEAKHLTYSSTAEATHDCEGEKEAYHTEHDASADAFEATSLLSHSSSPSRDSQTSQQRLTRSPVRKESYTPKRLSVGKMKPKSDSPIYLSEENTLNDITSAATNRLRKSKRSSLSNELGRLKRLPIGGMRPVSDDTEGSNADSRRKKLAANTNNDARRNKSYVECSSNRGTLAYNVDLLKEKQNLYDSRSDRGLIKKDDSAGVTRMKNCLTDDDASLANTTLSPSYSHSQISDAPSSRISSVTSKRLSHATRLSANDLQHKSYLLNHDSEVTEGYEVSIFPNKSDELSEQTDDASLKRSTEFYQLKNAKIAELKAQVYKLKKNGYGARTSRSIGGDKADRFIHNAIPSLTENNGCASKQATRSVSTGRTERLVDRAGEVNIRKTAMTEKEAKKLLRNTSAVNRKEIAKETVVVCKASAGSLEKTAEDTANKAGAQSKNALDDQTKSILGMSSLDLSPVSRRASFRRKSLAQSENGIDGQTKPILGMSSLDLSPVSRRANFRRQSLPKSHSSATLIRVDAQSSSSTSSNPTLPPQRKTPSSLPKRVGDAQLPQSVEKPPGTRVESEAVENSFNPSHISLLTPLRKVVPSNQLTAPPMTTVSAKGETFSLSCSIPSSFIKSSHAHEQSALLRKSSSLKNWDAVVTRSQVNLHDRKTSRLASFPIAVLCKAAIPTQRMARMFLAKVAVMKRRKSIVVVQSLIRRWGCVRYLKSAHMIAVRCQSAYKGMVVRDCLDFRHYCAMRIQTLVRGYFGVLAFAEIIRRTLLVQSVARRWITMKSYKEKRETNAAIVIQKNFRRLRALDGFSCQLSCVILCQAAARRFLAMRCATALRYTRDTIAAILIQTNFRRHRAMVELLYDISDVIFCQARVRRFLALKHTSHAIEVTCATKIQATWRRCLVSDIIILENKAALAIQTCFRQLLALKRGATLSAQNGKAALVIQTNFRRYSAMVGLVFTVLDVITCQATARRFLASKRAAILRCARNNNAALAIQKIMENEAVLAIQTCFRRYKGSLLFLATKTSVVQIQACIRGHLAKMMKLKRKDQMSHAAATTIQSCFRRHKEFLVYVVAKFSAIQIQAHVRGNSARRLLICLKQEKQENIDREIAIVLQNAAAIAIQSCFRGYQGFLSYVVTKFSVVQIQAVMRGYRARCHVQMLVQRGQEGERALAQHAAATAIQSCFRRHRCYLRFVIVQYFIIQVQAGIRGHQARCHFKRLKREVKDKQIKRNRRLNSAMQELHGNTLLSSLYFSPNKHKKILTGREWQEQREKKAALVIERFFITIRAEIESAIIHLEQQEQKRMTPKHVGGTRRQIASQRKEPLSSIRPLLRINNPTIHTDELAPPHLLTAVKRGRATGSKKSPLKLHTNIIAKQATPREQQHFTWNSASPSKGSKYKLHTKELTPSHLHSSSVRRGKETGVKMRPSKLHTNGATRHTLPGGQQRSTWNCASPSRDTRAMTQLIQTTRIASPSREVMPSFQSLYAKRN